MSALKDFYNNPNIEDSEEDSEEDSDFVPEENDSETDDGRDLEEGDLEEEEEQTSTKANKRSLEEEAEPSSSSSEDASSKKSRIDAIWAEMNNNDTKSPEITSPSLPTASSPPAAPSPSPKKITTKRPKSTLSSLVSKYNIKEPKMNTLEKSKLDWQGYVDREGIRDDLKYKNKDGYMEKVAFLQRVDDRRLSQLKQGQQKEK